LTVDQEVGDSNSPGGTSLPAIFTRTIFPGNSPGKPKGRCRTSNTPLGCGRADWRWEFCALVADARGGACLLDALAGPALLSTTAKQSRAHWIIGRREAFSSHGIRCSIARIAEQPRQAPAAV